MLTFTGGPQHTDTVWNNSANWEPQQVPMDGDSVIIGNNADWPSPVYDGGTLNLQDLSVGIQSFTCSGVIAVAGSFQWTGGFIADLATIRIQGQGSITGGSLPESPALHNDSTLDVSGTLTITGPGSLTIGGGQCRILNSGTITLDQGGLFWDSGAPPLVSNNGTITVAGTVPLHGGDITNLGVVNIPARSELVLMGGAVLRLAGGQVTGGGTVHPADDGQGFYGTVSIEADTVLPAELTLNLSGIGYVSGPEGSVLKPPTLRIDGTLSINGGTLYNARITISPKARCTISGTTSNVSSGEVDNLGVITLRPGAAWSLDSGAQINNSGRLSLQGNNSILLTAGFASMANAGLIESGETVLSQIAGLVISNTGNIAVGAGILNMVTGASLTVADGCVFLNGGSTTLDSSDGSASLALTGGTAGGVLRGTGSIGATVTNDGWIEPAAPGLVFASNFSQPSGGNLTLPAGALASSAQPLLSFNGPSASLGGSLWCLMSGPAAPATAELIKVSDAPLGQFTKVRVGDDDTRLVLGYPTAAGVISAQQVPAPGYYGLDFTAYPSGNEAAVHLQDLFDNTPFSYLGFYFKTTGHPGDSWHGKAQALLDQGWALLPIYVGRQQTWLHKSDNAISTDIAKATQQGNDDGNKAVSQAGQEGLPNGSLIFLDIEPTQDAKQPPNNVAPGPQTIAYIDAWLSTVGKSRYVAALYDANSHWEEGKKTYYEASVIHDKISSNPETWVSWGIFSPPSGVTTSQWPLDDNGDVCPIAIRRYSKDPRWDFTEFAKVWQFNTKWPTTAATVITDKGIAYPLSQIVSSIDLNTSLYPDPAHTSGSRPKKERRTKVTKVSAASASIESGATTTLTVTLDRKAASPNGIVVLLRCDSSDITVPSAARVAAGSTSVDVTAAAVVGASAATMNISSRTIYQLTDAPASMTLTITTS